MSPALYSSANQVSRSYGGMSVTGKEPTKKVTSLNRNAGKINVISPNIITITRQNLEQNNIFVTNNETQVLRATGRPDDSQIGYLDDPVPVGEMPVLLIIILAGAFFFYSYKRTQNSLQ